MSNTFRGETLVWEVTETAALTTEASQFANPIVRKIVYIPSAVDDDLVFQTGGSVNAIVLKAGSSDTSPIHIDFGEQGKRVEGIKCSTIDGGTAYVYLG